MPEEFAGATLAREGAADAEWLSALPALVERLRVRWDLEVDGPAMHGYVALVVPVRRTDGRPAVLKVSWVDAETRAEAVALAAWRDAPAVDLLAAAPEAGALLLERLDPTAACCTSTRTRRSPSPRRCCASCTCGLRRD